MESTEVDLHKSSISETPEEQLPIEENADHGTCNTALSVRTQPRGHGRKRKPEMCARNKKTALVVSSQAYINENGKSVIQKSVRQSNCNCTFNFPKNISPKHQETLFQEYYRFKTRAEQRLFLSSLMITGVVKTSRVEELNVL